MPEAPRTPIAGASERPPLRLSIIGHAGFHVQAGPTDLLVDPWLQGSCYWRSWWHYPPPAEVPEAWLSPRFVYLSHHHFDHFHYPSLRRLDRSIHVLVPRYGVDVMRGELAGLGFHHVTEMRHGRPLLLGDGVCVRSYQYGVDDSALVVSRGDTVIADLNDCKIRRRAMRQILDDHGPATLMLKNYSAAQAYPGCYTASRPADLELISRQGYLVDFREAAKDLSARYAVPFASMTCFLHPETLARNAEVILPGDLEKYFASHPLAGTELKVLAPGDGWSEDTGFSIAEGDPYASFHDDIGVMADEAAPKVRAAMAEEATHELSFESFAAFFGGFARSLPLPVRLLFKRPVVFEVQGEYWVIDVRARTVIRESELPAVWASVVRVPPGVLADAMDKKIVNFIQISMRLAVELNEHGTQTDFLFWGILTMYELGYFPLRRLSPVRILSATWDRRREFVDSAVGMVAGQGSGLERMAGSLMPTGSNPGAGS